MSTKDRPNILLITSDQQHWNTLGVFNPEIQTPNLDRLAREGLLCERAYCPNPTCTPTRASIITGLYPSQHGAYSLGTKLMENYPTVGDEFIRAGYATALIGKAHFQPLRGTEEYPSLEAYPILQDLDFWKNFNGPFYGFQYVQLARNHTDEAHVGQHYALWMEEKGLKNWREHFSRPTGTRSPQYGRWSLPEEYHYNRWITEKTCEQLSLYQKEGKNFFLWASFFDPHPSYLVPAPWDQMYDPQKLTIPEYDQEEFRYLPPHFQLTQQENPDFSSYRGPECTALHGMHSHRRDRKKLAQDIAIYYGMVSCLDHYVGMIIDQLIKLGLAENTLVVFTTDHGHFFGHHGLIAKGPFHYEDMIRVPFIVWAPGKVPSGKRISALISLVDLPVSFLSWCGLKVPRRMVGMDQTPVWRGEVSKVRDHIVVENLHDYPYVDLRTYVDERYKLTVYFRQSYGELFDLQEDPQERRNRWNDPSYASLKQELLLKMIWAEMAKEPRLMPRVAPA